MGVRECHEEVTRKGEIQPCNKVAVALRVDPEEGSLYPVCAYHTRGEMAPLVETLSDAWSMGHDKTCGRACAHYDGLGLPCINPFQEK